MQTWLQAHLVIEFVTPSGRQIHQRLNQLNEPTPEQLRQFERIITPLLMPSLSGLTVTTTNEFVV